MQSKEPVGGGGVPARGWSETLNDTGRGRAGDVRVQVAGICCVQVRMVWLYVIEGELDGDGGGQDLADIDLLGGVVAGVAGGAERGGGEAVGGFAGGAGVGEADEREVGEGVGLDELADLLDGVVGRDEVFF